MESLIDEALEASIASATGPSTPPTLAKALRYAVFPGGGRLRPQLCLLVAMVESGGWPPPDAIHAAAAIELLHCASLVHDDLPCFDDADARRGRPSVHRVFGEPIAVLVGDALIVHAFHQAARGPHAGALVKTLSDAAGSLRGLVAGQAWETEAFVSLEEYHRAKTASLFEAAAAMGAIASGSDADRWRELGEALGRAYQAADDIADAIGNAAVIGKPIGQDDAKARPSLVRSLGLEGARRHLATLVEDASASAMRGGGGQLLDQWLERVAARLTELQ
ncbi:MAG: polyprenyl synthetase family protein [Polyangiaceae bacterium]|nr:polyprenyl synthetase family protein [Polyangiaceae bacterium]